MILRRNIVIWLLFISTVQGLPSSGQKKSRLPTPSPSEAILQQHGLLPKEHQVSIHLKDGEMKR